MYPDPVRVLTIGISVDDVLNNPSSSAAIDHSVEFCGGTLVMPVMCDVDS